MSGGCSSGYVYADDSTGEALWVAFCPVHAWTGDAAHSRQLAFLRLRSHREFYNNNE